MQQTLANLGWRPVFQQQLNLDELETCTPARIMAQHRSEYVLQSEHGELHLPILHSMPPLTVGDWVLLDAHHQFVREL